VGILFGLPSLKVKEFYLALTTIAAQFIILYMIKTPFPEVTGGAIALHVPAVSLWGFVFETEEHFYYLIMFFLFLMTFFAKSITRSHIGRAFVAIRDNDIAAEAMGINLYYYKLLAFFIGCFYAGIAGAIWASYVKVISPDDFTLMGSIWMMGMLIIGGLGTTLGPIFGVIFIKALEELVLLSGPIIAAAIPQIGGQLSAASVEMAFGLALILFLIYEPRGFAHRWEILKESYRLWPFSY
jgi:branched-chain amino acid transport system permease protein